jgi:hypothetical protein
MAYLLRRKSIFLFILLVSLSTIRPAAAQVYEGICRIPGACCFDSSYKKAIKYVGTSNTRIPALTNIYITTENDSLYLQSNYISSGSKYPAKMATKEVDTLPNLVYEMLALEQTSGGRLSWEMPRPTFSKHYSKITFYIDKKLINDPKYGSLLLGEARNVKIVDEAGKARTAKQLVDEDGKPQWLIEYRPSIFANATKEDAPELIKIFDSQSFKKSDVRLLSLTTDGMTNRKIRELMPDAQIDFDWSSTAKLRQSLSANRDRLIFALGHIEDNSFVVKDPSNTRPLAKVSLTGCESQ